MREDDNDLDIERVFFSSRGKVKNPRVKRKKISEAEFSISSDLIGDKKKRRRGNAYQYTRGGFRSDLGEINCRSSWEANVLRVLKIHQIPFEFEPKTFEFPEDARGHKSSYLPDIYLTRSDEYIEVKGMLDARGKSKLRKFKKHYPEEFKKLTVIISKSNKENKFFFRQKLGVKNILFYEHLSKLFSEKVEYWEGK